MLNKESDKITVTDDFGKWVAEHPLQGINGPLKLTYKQDTVVVDCTGYCGEKSEANAVSKKIKDYHKAGCSVIEAEGFIPFEDGRINYKNSYKYSNKRVKVVSDISFQGNCPIKRHFGTGSLFLPGKWKSIYIIPAADLLVHGATEKSIEIPEYTGSPLMLGHWHRPPLSVTFKRPNGTALEVGTGSDIWRWEENLGYSPESGSYKIVLEEDGIRFIREPLACCEEFTPENRSYRISWYMAWRENGANKTLPNHQEFKLNLDHQGEIDTQQLRENLKRKSLYAYAILDFNQFEWKENQLTCNSPYDFIRGIKTSHACFAPSSVGTKIKKVIRKLVEMEELDGIIFKNFTPKICFETQHVNKKHENGTAHWDINSLFDFASWTTNACKDKLDLFWGEEGTEQPSLLGLFD